MRHLVFAGFACLSVVANADPARLAEYSKAALTSQGDVEAGRILFNDAKRTKCATCHKLDGKGGEVGPDLTRIGAKFDRPHLIESILEPSRQMVEGYQTSTLLLKDGRVLAGVIREESDAHVVLHQADGKPTRIDLDAVEQRQSNQTSIMPANLADDITSNEFTNLVAFLETLGTRGKMTPGANIVGAVTLPDGFAIETIVTGLDGVTQMETLPDGRVLICEQAGQLRVVKDGELLATPMLDLDVEMHWERGLIGVTVHPQFPEKPYLYVCYVRSEPYSHHRISRFTVSGDVADATSEVIFIKGDDQSTLGGFEPAGHQGGAMHFGPDGKLYVGIGEQTAKTPSQKLDTLQGKILRFNDDGSIPNDNPFYARTTGKYQSIWAIGCRNPWTFAFDPDTGEMLICDVGGEFEEINVGLAGRNYGWPVVDHGPNDDERYEAPIHWYPQSSIGGADFVSKTTGWPAKFQGRFVFADYVHGWVHTIDPENGAVAGNLVNGLRRPVDLRFAKDGSGALYVLLRNAWVVDKKFEGDTGSLVRIYPKG